MINMSSEAQNIFFGTLANPNRLKIIGALRKKDCNVTQIIGKTGLEQTCVSHCLARLERCGFVTARRKGKYKLYRLNKTTIEPLMGLIEKHIQTYCIHLAKGRMDNNSVQVCANCAKKERKI